MLLTSTTHVLHTVERPTGLPACDTSSFRAFQDLANSILCLMMSSQRASSIQRASSLFPTISPSASSSSNYHSHSARQLSHSAFPVIISYYSTRILCFFVFFHLNMVTFDVTNKAPQACSTYIPELLEDCSRSAFSISSSSIALRFLSILRLKHYVVHV